MNIDQKIPKGTICVNCQKHVATVKWAGEEGFFASTHGFLVPWCRCCAVKYQIDYAKKLAALISEREKELAEAIKNECK